MIHLATKFLRDQVNEYLRVYLRLGNTDPDRVVLSNLVDNNDSDMDEIPTDRILLSLVHIEEERIFKAQEANIKRNDSAHKGKPELKLNLYVLFGANYTFNNYEEGLKSLSGVITCFQGRNVFEPASFPDLDPAVRRLVVDLYSPSMEQASQMWQAMGGKFLPSVIFKLRLVVIQDDRAQYPVTLIEQIDTN